MSNRGSLGMVLLAGGLALLAACGSDNSPVFPPVPTSTPVPTTAPPTAPPTSTRTPTELRTSTPTATPGGATPTPTVTHGVGPAICGNGSVEPPEECDCGAVCVKGEEAMLGQSCTADGGCGSGGDCRPVGGQQVGTGQPGSCASGDPCSANCTFETASSAKFVKAFCTKGTVGAECDPNGTNQCGQTCGGGACGCDGGSQARVQLTILPLFLPVQGTQTYRYGKMRTDTVKGPSDKVLYQPGQIPLALRAPTTRGEPQTPDIVFNPIPLPGVNTCVCLRIFEQPAFGPGLAGVGTIGCGDDGLTGADYMQAVNHNAGVISQDECLALAGQGQSPPSGVEVGGTGTCSSTTLGECSGPASGGVTWWPDEACNMTTQCNDPHPTICNYIPNPPTFSTTQGPQGSAVLSTYTSTSAISGDGTCTHTCTPIETGMDCDPCTDDDRRQGIAQINYSVTGTASASVANANPAMGSTTPTGISLSVGSLTPCTTDTNCPAGEMERCYNDADPTKLCMTGDTCRCRKACGSTSCVTTATGKPFDCSLQNQPEAFIPSGMAVSAFGALHAAAGADTVATTHFVIEPETSSSAVRPSTDP